MALWISVCWASQFAVKFCHTCSKHTYTQVSKCVKYRYVSVGEKLFFFLRMLHHSSNNKSAVKENKGVQKLFSLSSRLRLLRHTCHTCRCADIYSKFVMRKEKQTKMRLHLVFFVCPAKRLQPHDMQCCFEIGSTCQCGKAIGKKL